MSSMVLKSIAAGLLLTVSAPALAQSATFPGQPLPVAPRAYAADPVGIAVANWRRLRQSDSYSFADYANFLMANPGWPGEPAMRKVAENAVDTASYSPAQVNSYFARFPATTATGEARHAFALSASGDQTAARAAARRAWHGGMLGPQDEARLLQLFGASFTTDDHDRRMERLLWSNATSSAARQVGYTSPAKRSLFAARLALQQRAPDAASQAAMVDAAWRNDPGLIVDRAGWLRKGGDSAGARALLARPRTLSAPPLDAEEWFETLLTNARGAANDRQWTTAYEIARQVDDGYAPGVQVRDRPIGERDDYTSLVWLAGTTALKQRARPVDAIPLFERYASAARSPQTQSKGYYWAGRAALAAGQPTQATGYFGRAAAFGDQFYGQLARERLGQAMMITPAIAPAVTQLERDSYNQRSVVRAARYLGQSGQWQDQTQFLRALAQEAKSPAEHYLAGELSRQIRRPDLGVMIGRSAGVNGHGDPLGVSFPVTSVPGGHDANFTMIHAIARQESQFDRQAVSHAGARGLMQLMPGTARETSGKIGASYSLTGLTDDPAYNVRLGSTYFQNMLRYYGGSYPLATAAYNAGPGNVNKWLRANGDPRSGSIDMIDWIEAIPIYETRNYVQRVLENAVVYDQLRPNTAPTRGSRIPLSWYLGKRTPG